MEAVKAKLARSGGRFYWQFICPKCGNNRASDAGNYTEDPRKYLGNRKLRCGHYADIQIADESQVKKILRREEPMNPGTQGIKNNGFPPARE